MKKIKWFENTNYIISLEKEDEIGSGSFGQVVRAYDIYNIKENLVCKIINITKTQNI